MDGGQVDGSMDDSVTGHAQFMIFVFDIVLEPRDM